MPGHDADPMSKGESFPECLFLHDGKHGGDAIAGAFLYLLERYRRFLGIFADVRQLFAV